MKALSCVTPGKFEYIEVPKAVLEKGHAIIKINRIGVCGTDLHAFQGTQPYFNYPRILGHELSGELIEADGASGFQIGEYVTFVPYFNCGKCIACRNGKPNCCTNIKVCGVHVDGGMTEYLQVPVDTLVHGEGLSLDELALVEPLAIGAHGISRANVQAGEFVLVVGAGPIGLGLMEFARIAGAHVIAMDVNQERLDFCKTFLGVAYTINAANEDIIEALKQLTDNDFPTVVIDATGNQRAINNGIQYLAHGGRYVLVGLQKGDLVMSHPEFHKRESTLMSSRNATHQDFKQVISAIKNGLVKPSNYITHKVSFDAVKDEFEKWLDPANGVIKAMIEVD